MPYEAFFGVSSREPTTSRQLQPRFHQESPHRYCHLPFGPTQHRDPRCSLECRAAWAAKEAAILTTYLGSLPESTFIYFGELKVQADITVQDHKTIRRAFLKGITALAKGRKATIKVYVNSELDGLNRCHYHFCMTSTVKVVQHAVKTVWDEACTGWPTVVSHGEPRSIVARAKYQFADLLDPGDVRLFRKKTLRTTWGHAGRSGFFPEPKETYWRRFIEKTKKEKSYEQL